jgi:hypothetical protein
MASIKVPKTPKRAFDPQRKASQLLLDQVRHLEWAALPAAKRNARWFRKKRRMTEGQAAARVRQLTELVRQAADKAQVEKTSGSAAVTKLPPLPPAASPASARSRPRPSKRRSARKKKGVRR